MKFLLTFIYLFFLTFLSFAQSPDGVNYQAVIRDSGGELKMNQSVNIDFEMMNISDAYALFVSVIPIWKSNFSQ